MPEGHTVHRTANHINRAFENQFVRVSSPQGRFSGEAKLVDKQRLIRAWAVGKQMFIDFENDLSIHIHLGIYGKWQFHSSDVEPDVVGQVRMRIAGNQKVVDLRGPTTCEVIGIDEVNNLLKRFGPDPLNPNPRRAESNRFSKRVRASKSSIGLLLMNQQVISGIGNVYRAELLYRHGLNPHTPGNLITDEQLQALWDDCVALMKVGVKTGFMITRDELFTKRPTKEERNWVYKREGQPCRGCGTEVILEIMATRKLYWCPRCQA